MGAFISIDSDFNPALYLVNNFLQTKDRVHTGLNNREQDKVDAKRNGYTVGVCEGIAAIVGGARANRYSKSPRIILPSARDVETKILFFAVELNEEMMGQMPARTPHEEAQKVREAMMRKIHEHIIQFTFPPEMEDEEMERHKAAVMNGTEQPTEDDYGWMQAELQKIEADAERLRSLYDGPAVKPPRPIKDTPQA